MEDLKTPWELFGVECGEGWFPLIEPILQYIQSYNKDKAEEYQIVVYQIKEKWGILQLEIATTRMSLQMNRSSEKQSTTTCEKCGAPGSLRDCRGWYHTLCDKCFEKQLKE